MRTKGKKASFEDLTVGHTFAFDGRETLKGDAYFWCDLCGTRGQKVIRLRRDDGVAIEVGGNCLKKVQVVLPEGAEATEEKPAEQVSSVSVEEKKEDISEDDLDALFDDISEKK